MRFRKLLIGVVLVAVASIATAWVWHALTPLFVINHAPARYDRRSGAFAAHITGTLDERAERMMFRLNDGDWQIVRQQTPRVPPPNFTIELLPSLLRTGSNNIEIVAESPLRAAQRHHHRFTYDASQPALPLTVDWSKIDQLDVQDGQWEVIRDAAGRGWVRPVPGTENWDRIVVASGAFHGARRVQTQAILRETPRGRLSWGFGVFPLWGGQPEPTDHRPRRGWRFGLAWYSSGYGGVGTEFSEKIGDGSPMWVGTYRNLDMEVGRPYNIVTETWPLRRSDGELLAWNQRMKWWADGDPEPEEWLYIDDRWGAPLPDGDFGVTLFSLRAQVEFGTVLVTSMTTSQ